MTKKSENLAYCREHERAGSVRFGSVFIWAGSGSTSSFFSTKFDKIAILEVSLYRNCKNSHLLIKFHKSK